MAETVNISQVANKIANDIFKVFFWEMHSQQDTNFACVSDEHKTENGAKKQTHPGDVVFHYLDPYLNKRIYLHTDLKSYKKSTPRTAGSWKPNSTVFIPPLTHSGSPIA